MNSLMKLPAEELRIPMVTFEKDSVCLGMCIARQENKDMWSLGRFYESIATNRLFMGYSRAYMWGESVAVFEAETGFDNTRDEP